VARRIITALLLTQECSVIEFYPIFNYCTMPEEFAFERFFSTSKEQQPLLPNVEVRERADEDERRIIDAEYTGGLAQPGIEEALIAAFQNRVKRQIGSYLTDSDVRQKDLDFLATSEGLGGRFSTVREIGAAVVRRRVALIAVREGLDLTLAEREGLRAALTKKHTEAVEQERS
jgi:hypothetical protein